MTAEGTPGWTLETMYIHLLALMDERDRRYQERFEAQEQAVLTALNQANKEFREHIQQVREETRAALVCADKAITKSEEANDRRFDSVNEFRAALTDQAATFLPRSEYDRSLGGLAKRIDEIHNSLLSRIDSVSHACTAQIELVESRMNVVEAVVR